MRVHRRQIVTTESHFFVRQNYRGAVGRFQKIVVWKHPFLDFINRIFGKGQKHPHGVSVKVGIVSGADGRMEFDGVAVGQYRVETEDRQFMERRRPVQQYRVVSGNFLQNVVNDRLFFFQEILGAFNVRRKTPDDNFMQEEWFK